MYYCVLLCTIIVYYYCVLLCIVYCLFPFGVCFSSQASTDDNRLEAKGHAQVVKEKDAEILELRQKLVETKADLSELRERYHARDGIMSETEKNNDMLTETHEQSLAAKMTAERVRDELIEKLDYETRFIKILCQTIDLYFSEKGGVEILMQNLPFNGEDAHDSSLLQDFEGLRTMVSRHTNNHHWKEQRTSLQNIAEQKRHLERAKARQLALSVTGYGKKSGAKKGRLGPASKGAKAGVKK